MVLSIPKIFSITFIFDKCHHSLAAETPVKYERGFQQVAFVSIILEKKWEYNGTEEIALVTPADTLYNTLRMAL